MVQVHEEPAPPREPLHRIHEEPAPPSGPLHHMLDQLRAASEDRLHERRLVTLLEAIVDAVEPAASLDGDASPFDRMAARARELLDAADLRASDLVRYDPSTGRITAVSAMRGVAARDLCTLTTDGRVRVGFLFAAAPDLAHALLQAAQAWQRERARVTFVEREADREIRALKEALQRAQREVQPLAIQANEQRQDIERLAAERDAAVRIGETLRTACDHYLQALRSAANALDAQKLNLPTDALDHLAKARALVRSVFPSDDATPAPPPPVVDTSPALDSLSEATAELVAQVKEIDLSDLQELARSARETAQSEALHRIACDLYRDLFDALVAHVEAGDLTAARSLVSALPRDAKGPRPPVTVRHVFALREAWTKTLSPDAAEPR